MEVAETSAASDSVRSMSDNEKAEAKPDHEPPAGAEITATWTGGATPLDYTASAKWLVLRKKEKPAAPRAERIVVARLQRPRVRRSDRHRVQPRHREREVGRRQGQEGRLSRSQGVFRVQARPRVVV